MAEKGSGGIEVGSVYVSVIPSAKGFGKTLVTEADSQMKVAGTQLGTTLSKGITTSVGKDLATRTSAAIAQAGTGQASAIAARTGQGIGQALADGVTGTVGARVGPGLSKAFAGGSAAAKALAQDLTGLAGKTASLGSVQKAVGGVTGSLGGLASMVGYGGPLGIALAAGAAALGVYQTAQENAQAAAERLAATLNPKTGAATGQTYQDVATNVLKEFSSPDLKQTPFTLAEITAAIVKGGDALTQLQARIAAAKDAAVKDAGLNLVRADQEAEKYNRLQNTVTNLANDQAGALEVNRAAQEALNAATAAGSEAAFKASVQMTEAEKATIRQEAAAKNAAVAQGIFQASLDGVQKAGQEVVDRINAIPRDVTITAKDVGLDTLLSKINAIIDAYIRAAAAASAANQIIADGERHGADVAQSPAARNAGQAAAAADAAAAAAKAAQAAHNTAAAAARASRHSSGGGSRAVPSFTDTIDVAVGKTARQIAQDAATFLASARKVGITASSALGKQLATQVRQLDAYSKARDKVTAKLAAETKVLDALKQKYDDLANGIRGAITSYANVGQAVIPGINTASGFLGRLRTLANGAKAYAAALAKLKAAGASNALLEQVALAGVEQGTKIAETLLAGGTSSIADANALTASVASVADSTAKTLADGMYGAGISAAEGLIKGLQSKQSALTRTMTAIADAMVAEIKRRLGIHSPSRVTHALGVNTALGFQRGIESGTPGVLAASRGMTSLTGGLNPGELHIQPAVFNVFVGNEQLDARMDYRIERAGAATVGASTTRTGY